MAKAPAPRSSIDKTDNEPAFTKSGRELGSRWSAPGCRDGRPDHHNPLVERCYAHDDVTWTYYYADHHMESGRTFHCGSQDLIGLWDAKTGEALESLFYPVS